MKRYPVWEAANSCSQKTHIEIWSPFSKLAIAAFAQTVRVQTVPGMGSSLWLLYDCSDCHSKIFGKSNQSIKAECASAVANSTASHLSANQQSFARSRRSWRFVQDLSPKKVRPLTSWTCGGSGYFWNMMFPGLDSGILRDLFILHCYWRSLWYTATLSYFCTARDLHRTIALVWCQWQKEPLWRLWSCWLWVWPNVGGHYELQIRGFSCL